MIEKFLEKRNVFAVVGASRNPVEYGTKFVYRRNFNNTHGVSIEGTTVKINRFMRKAKKNKKHKKNTSPHKTALQSWGL